MSGHRSYQFLELLRFDNKLLEVVLVAVVVAVVVVLLIIIDNFIFI